LPSGCKWDDISQIRNKRNFPEVVIWNESSTFVL
jgi:hypothetical protein